MKNTKKNFVTKSLKLNSLENKYLDIAFMIAGVAFICFVSFPIIYGVYGSLLALLSIVLVMAMATIAFFFIRSRPKTVRSLWQLPFQYILTDLFYVNVLSMSMFSLLAFVGIVEVAQSFLSL